MARQDITTGFQSVDNGQTDFLVRFPEDINRLPDIQGCFTEQLHRPDIGPGQRLLDVGCGIGDRVFEMAKRAAPDGAVAGTDISETMLAVSRERHAGKGLPLSFHVAPAAGQPFENASFDAIRAERCSCTCTTQRKLSASSIAC